jgi:hypothetical protein
MAERPAPDLAGREALDLSFGIAGGFISYLMRGGRYLKLTECVEVAVVVKSARLIFGDGGGGILVVERDVELGFSGHVTPRLCASFHLPSRCPDLPVPLSNYKPPFYNNDLPQ